MQSVHRIDMNMDLIFKKGSMQSYLDAYLYKDIHSSQRNVAVSQNQAIVAINASNNLLY